MAGQAHHFRVYAPEQIEYAINRYTNEVNRLYGVMDKRLSDREYLAGEYSIADMASWPWVVPWKTQGQDMDHFPHLKRWLEAISARPAVERARGVGRELAQPQQMDDEAKKMLFGQTAASVRASQSDPSAK
jgi:GSH-dependent disulfide-bond oxidoreductase